jgi:hypothetical protein
MHRVDRERIGSALAASRVTGAWDWLVDDHAAHRVPLAQHDNHPVDDWLGI